MDNIEPATDEQIAYLEQNYSTPEIRALIARIRQEQARADALNIGWQQQHLAALLETKQAEAEVARLTADRDAWEDVAGQDARRRDEFAAEVVELRAEVDRLTRELEAYREPGSSVRWVPMGRHTALEAEVARLREVLNTALEANEAVEAENDRLRRSISLCSGSCRCE